MGRVPAAIDRTAGLLKSEVDEQHKGEKKTALFSSPPRKRNTISEKWTATDKICPPAPPLQLFLNYSLAFNFANNPSVFS